jgi:hypothetical protein
VSRYRDLGNTWWDAQTRFNKLYQQHLSAAVRLVNGFREFLDVPNAAFHYMPLRGELDSSTPGSVEVGTGFEADGWFHVRFRITFSPTEDPTPAQPIVFEWGLRPDSRGGWEVRTEAGGGETLVRSPDRDGATAVYRAVADGLAPFLERSMLTVTEEGSVAPQVEYPSGRRARGRSWEAVSGKR